MEVGIAKGRSLNLLEEAVLRTVIYADVFNFPMTSREIAHFLIADKPYSHAEIESVLRNSQALRFPIESIDGLWFCRGRTELVEMRRERERASAQLWSQAARCGRWLSYLPFVRMVALTGALAMRNAAHATDDIDYLLVTAPGRVWTARLFAVVLVRLAKLRGVTICPNYVLSEHALAQSRHTLYMAHEVVQMIPLYGQAIYETMRDANAWVYTQMANANQPFYDLPKAKQNRISTWLKRAAEAVLGGAFGDALDAWECRRKMRRFEPELNKPHAAAHLDRDHVKGHFDDHGHFVMRAYEERLHAYGITGSALPLAGD